MSYAPAQMNKTKAAEYCGVSVKIFTSRYQPHLTAREDGNLYFLTSEMDELIKGLFHEERQSKQSIAAKPKPRMIRSQSKSSFKQKIASR